MGKNLVRNIGFLLIAFAVIFGLVLPWAQLNFDGDEIASLEFDNFNRTALHENTVLLTRADNPVRLRFFARYKIDGLLPPVKVPIQVKVSDKAGTLLGAIVSFPTDGRGAGPEQPPVTSGTSILLNVQNDGLHKLELAFAPNRNNNGIATPDVDGITVTFIGNASEILSEYRIPIALSGLLGVYLIMRSKRKGKGPPAKPQWGRRA